MKPVLKTEKNEVKPLISPPCELGVPSGSEKKELIIIIIIIIMAKESEDEVDTDCLYCAGDCYTAQVSSVRATTA